MNVNWHLSILCALGYRCVYAHVVLGQGQLSESTEKEQSNNVNEQAKCDLCACSLILWHWLLLEQRWGRGADHLICSGTGFPHSWKVAEGGDLLVTGPHTHTHAHTHMPDTGLLVR